MKKVTDEYANKKILEITFTEKISVNEIQDLGEVKEHQEKRVVLEVNKTDVKKIASKILNDLPVDDILINEIGVDEVIRNIFTHEKK